MSYSSYTGRCARAVTAIVAAYNEGPRIASVLQVLCQVNFHEIIVIDDGSDDDTSAVASQFPGVKVITLAHNRGKAKALELGVTLSTTPYVFFCDADVVGLTPEIIRATIQPVVSGNTIMMVAMRHRVAFKLRCILHLVPILGGERCLDVRLWKTVPPQLIRGFMIELALNEYARRLGGFEFEVFPGLTQVIKEKKRGLHAGLLARVKMLADIVHAWWLLRWI